MFEQVLTSGLSGYVFVPPAVVPGTPYKGFVKASDLIRGDSLATLVGLTDGTAINPDAGWLHYIDGEAEFYIARLPIRYGMSGASLTAASQKTGMVVTINAQEYKVRMMSGMSVDPFTSIVSNDGGGEWNKYMYPIYGGSDRPAGVQWSYYTNQELGLTEIVSTASISLVKETHNSIANAYAGRGRDYSGGTSVAPIARRTVINDGSTAEGNGGFGRNAYGWRPLLEYLPAAPVITDTWENQGVMPIQRSRWSAVEIGGLIYLFGGYNESTAIQGTLHSFNPATKTFTALASGQPRGFHDAVAINGKMYVFGGLDSGSTYTNTVQCYDPTTNTWSYPTVQGAALTARARIKLVASGDAFIIIGGLTTGGGSVGPVQKYDTITQQASTISGSIDAAIFGAADNGSGTVYLSGGYLSAPQSNFDALTVATGSVLSRAALPSTRYSHVSFYAKSGVYMIGGAAGTPTDATKVMRYTPGTNTWTTLGTVPYTVGENAAMAKVGSDVFIFGGNGAAGSQSWKYTP